MKAGHSSIQTPNLCGTISPDATDACDPNETQPDNKAPAIKPLTAPFVLLHGTNIPSVKTPNVVPAAIADRDVASCNTIYLNQILFPHKQIFNLITANIPPNCSTTNNSSIAKIPNAKILPFTINADIFSEGLPLKHPLKISSNNTAAVEFKTTDRELEIKLKYLFYMEHLLFI